jgi:hypothetical protein
MKMEMRVERRGFKLVGMLSCGYSFKVVTELKPERW